MLEIKVLLFHAIHGFLPLNILLNLYLILCLFGCILNLWRTQ